MRSDSDDTVAASGSDDRWPLGGPICWYSGARVQVLDRNLYAVCPACHVPVRAAPERRMGALRIPLHLVGGILWTEGS